VGAARLPPLTLLPNPNSPPPCSAGSVRAGPDGFLSWFSKGLRGGDLPPTECFAHRTPCRRPTPLSCGMAAGSFAPEDPRTVGCRWQNTESPDTDTHFLFITMTATCATSSRK